DFESIIVDANADAYPKLLFRRYLRAFFNPCDIKPTGLISSKLSQSCIINMRQPYAMSEERFKGEVLTGHKEPTVEVPFEPELVWGISPKPIRPGRRGYAVRGSLNGFEFESCIVSRMNKFYLLVDDQPRRAAGVLPGDIVNVTVEPMSQEKPEASTDP